MLPSSSQYIGYVDRLGDATKQSTLLCEDLLNRSWMAVNFLSCFLYNRGSLHSERTELCADINSCASPIPYNFMEVTL